MLTPRDIVQSQVSLEVKLYFCQISHLDLLDIVHYVFCRREEIRHTCTHKQLRWATIVVECISSRIAHSSVNASPEGHHTTVGPAAKGVGGSMV